jgi:hypothetical protein
MMDDQEMPDDKTLGGTGKRDLVFTRVFDAPIERCLDKMAAIFAKP